MMKATHAESHYRMGHGETRCANCTMFRPPSSCTSVQSPIEGGMLCDYFKKKTAPQSMNYGAMVGRARAY